MESRKVTPTSAYDFNNPYARPKASLLTIIQKLMDGEIPSNSELQYVLESAKRVVTKQSQEDPSLNPHERIILGDIQELLQDSELLVSQKNPHEKWQQFFVKHLSPNAPSTAGKVIPSVTQSQRIQTGEPSVKIGSQMRQTLSFWASTLQTLITSTEFRALLLDLVSFVQDIMQKEMERHGDVAQDLKSELRSGQDTSASSVAPKVKSLVKNVSNDIKTGNVEMDPRQRDLIIQRFRDTLRRLARNQNFHRAMNSVFILIDSLVSEAGKVKEEVDKSTGGVASSAPKSMWRDFSDIIDEYIGKRYMSRFNADFSTLYTEVKRDQQTTSWFQHLRHYIEDAMKHPESLQEDSSMAETEELFNQGKSVGEKWKDHQMLQRVIKDIQKIFMRLKDDPLTIKVLNDTRNFTNHMFRDEMGNLDLQNTWEGFRILRFLMIPLIWEQLETFPIPKMEGENEKFKWMFDEMYIKEHSVLPKDIDLKFKNHAIMNFRDNPSGKSIFQITARLSNLDLKMDNVKYYLKKKKGFPKFEDQGRMNFIARGYENFLVVKWLVESERGKPLFFRTKSVVSKIAEINPKFVESNHKRSFKSLTFFGKSTIRKRVNTEIENRINLYLDQVNSRLNEFAAQRWEASKNRWLSKPTVGLAQQQEQIQKRKKAKKPKKLKKAQPTGEETTQRGVPLAATTGVGAIALGEKTREVEGDQPVGRRYQEGGPSYGERTEKGVQGYGGERAERGTGYGGERAERGTRGVTFGEEPSHVRPHVVSDSDKMAQDIEKTHSTPRIIATSSDLYTPPQPSRAESYSGDQSLGQIAPTDRPSSSSSGSQTLQPKEKEIFVETPSDMNKMSQEKKSTTVTSKKDQSAESVSKAPVSVSD